MSHTSVISHMDNLLASEGGGQGVGAVGAAGGGGHIIFYNFGSTLAATLVNISQGRYIYLTRLIRLCAMTLFTRDVTHSHVCHDSFTCVP